MTLRSPLFRKLLLSGFLLILVTLVSIDFLLTRYTENRETEHVEHELETSARILASELPYVAPREMSGFVKRAAQLARARVTIIDRNGVVLADSQHDPETMENHAQRPEVREALAGRRGIAIRHSATVDIDFCYLALPASYGGASGAVLRVAVPMHQLSTSISAVRNRILGASMLAALLALIVAYFFSRALTRRIRKVQEFADALANADFSHSLEKEPNDEVGALAASLKKTAAQLHEMLDRLLHLERIRKDFVANVSHEFRTPLAAIRGYAETLLDGGLDDSEHNRRFVEIIHAQAMRLNNIASDLLVLSDLESGAGAPPPDKISVREAIESALHTVEPEALVREVNLFTGDVAGVYIMGHRFRVEQALVNLMQNAVKFNRPGGEVRVKAVNTDGGRVRISVSDNGIGIPTEDLPRIFERIYRVDKARSREVGGTGLGLSIVKHIAERMNGRVSVESELGKGSTFTLEFPSFSSRAAA
jgi:two-component system phosphate regulon sensor histidine kinase PhoR